MTDHSNDMSEFEAALQSNLETQVKAGDIVDGVIAAIHGDIALVDIGGKSEAFLDRAEIDDLGTGDPVEVYIVEAGDDLKVSRRIALERRLNDRLIQAAANDETVEGKVVGRRKGGFDVTVAGVRGFCPMSQIDIHRSDDLDHHLGQTYTFAILEFDAADDNRLVVSRARHLRAEREVLSEETWEKVVTGAVLSGKVRSLTDFGAFVDLGGVDGMVHVTQIAHRRIGKPADVLSVGQEIDVKVVSVDREKQRIALSMKDLAEDPWATARDRFEPGSKVEGKIVRKAHFGAFVELDAGVDGLLHSSQLLPGMKLDDPELAEGEMIELFVKDVDPDAQRISLSLRNLPDRDPWERVEMRYQEGALVEATVENGTTFGVFVELEPGLSGLIPASELIRKGTERVDPTRVLEPGQTLTVKIMTIDSGKRRMSLSQRAVEREREREVFRKHAKSSSSSPASTGGTDFGSALSAALKPKKK